MSVLTVDGTLPKLVATLELAEATRLARAGHYGEAEAALSVTRSVPAGLDLRARIAAQQQRYGEAASLWREAAELLGEPDAFAGELAAVSRLQRRRFRPVPFAAAGLVLVGVLAGWALARRPASSSPEPLDGAPGDDPANLGQQVEESRTAVEELAQRFDELAEELEPPQPGVLESRLASLDGVEATWGDEALHVQLTIPVFSEGTTFTPTGQVLLAGLADALAPDAHRYVILAAGHTDALPLRPGGEFDDNEDLALARARAAVAELVVGGLSADRLAATVTPMPPPYASDNADFRNRTITLAIYEQTR